MRHSLTTIALGALLFSQGVLAGLYSSKDAVIDITTANFEAEVTNTDHLVMLEFYAPWCGHCKNLVPEYKAAAKNLQGIVKFGAIDCDDDKNRPVCAQYGIKGFPTIKAFPAKKTKSGKKTTKDYNGERKAKAMIDYLLPMVPNHIQQVSHKPTTEKTKNFEEFKQDQESPRALLLTKKTTSSNMYKGLSTDLLGRLTVAEMRNPEADIVEQLNISSLPAVVVFPKGSTEHVVYEGDLKREPLSVFLNSHAAESSGTGSGSSSSSSSSSSEGKPAAAVVEFNPEVVQLVDQEGFKKECLDRPIGSCAIAFLVVEDDFPESVEIHNENLRILREIKLAAHKANRPTQVMWMDALDKRVVNVINQFGLSSDIPGLVLVIPSRKAFVPFIGAFDVEGIQEWLSATSAGKAKAYPYSFDLSLPAIQSKPASTSPDVSESSQPGVRDEL